jgi:hypothetical protein
MPRFKFAHARQARTQLVRVICLAALFAVGAGQAGGRSDRVNLFPNLHAGQILIYEVGYQSEKQTKTQSSVSFAEPPPSANVEAHALLRLEVLGVQAQGDRASIHARARFVSRNSAAQAKIPNADPPRDPAPQENSADPSIEFTIFPDGRIDQVKGLDALLPEQQQAWQEWVSRFAVAAVFPENGVKVAQKWKTEETEKSPSPISELSWIRESTYVRNEPCRPAQTTAQGEVVESGEQPADTCAVILTTAALKQHSSPKDATPEDFKLHQLRTMGTAHGANKTITYISLKTRLVVRATEEADQSMHVTIAKADGSNQVHYDVRARSHSEVLLVADAPQHHP